MAEEKRKPAPAASADKQDKPAASAVSPPPVRIQTEKPPRPAQAPKVKPHQRSAPKSEAEQKPFEEAAEAVASMPADRAAKEAAARAALESLDETDATEKAPEKKLWGRAEGEAKPPPDPAALAAAARIKAEKHDKFMRNVWTPWLKPIVVLTCICLVTSLLLGLTNLLTKPYEEANQLAVAEAARRAVLPQADSFTNETPDEVPFGISSVYKADNGAGYVIEAYGTGYGGQVPAMVGIAPDGHISGVQFLDNNETPGLGKKLNTDASFAAQFEGRISDEEVLLDSIDVLAAATISTNAALSAVNAATQYYTVNVMGGTLLYNLPESVMQQLLPEAAEWWLLDVEAPGLAGAYRGDDGSYVLVGQAAGVQTVTVAVAVGEDGIIRQIWMDTSRESEGYGRELADDYSYTGQFIGQSSSVDVDTIAGVTLTTRGINEAVDIALGALELAKEAG